MRPSQVMEHAREKLEEAAEKTGEVIGKGLKEGWGKAKDLGKGLKKELLRVHRKTGGNKMPEKKARSRRISDEAVKAETGKVWWEWFTILDTWGAKEKGHTQSAEHLHEHYGLSPWWAQAVTIHYEWERGLSK